MTATAAGGRDAARPDKRFDLLVIGEPLYELSEADAGGQAVYRAGFGGDVSNAAVAAARQGARAAIYTRLGDDTFGRRFLELWRTEGVDASTVELDGEAHTGVYTISYGPDGHEFSYLRKGSAASLMRPEDVPTPAVAASRVLHASAISQAISPSACDAVFAAVAAAQANGTAFSYDTNLRLKLWPLARARAITLATVALADYCLPSLEDAVTLTGLSGPDAIVDEFLRLGARVVVLKLGADGALVADATGRTRLPGHAVERVDATGAGDCFDGAFLARVAAGDDPVTAARYANAAAALSVTGHGAVGPIPTAAQVRAFLAARDEAAAR